MPEKKLSPINVWALALGCIIGWGAFVMPGNTFLGKAGPLGTAIAVTGLLGTIFAIIFMVLLLVPIPMLGCSLGKESYICLIIWIILGAVFYKTTKR